MKTKSPPLHFLNAQSIKANSEETWTENDTKKQQLFLTIIVALLVLLWSYTTVSKLIDIEQFRQQLFNQSFSHGTAIFLLWFIPISEIIATVFLLIPRSRLSGLILSAILMLLFTGYIALVLLGYYERTPCSCGGVLKELGWHQHLYFNLFFLAISLIGIYLHHRILKTTIINPNH